MFWTWTTAHISASLMTLYHCIIFYWPVINFSHSFGMRWIKYIMHYHLQLELQCLCLNSNKFILSVIFLEVGPMPSYSITNCLLWQPAQIYKIHPLWLLHQNAIPQTPILPHIGLNDYQWMCLAIWNIFTNLICRIIDSWLLSNHWRAPFIRDLTL